MESHLLPRAPWGPFHPSGQWQTPPHRNLLLGLRKSLLLIVPRRRNKSTLPYSTLWFSFKTGTLFCCREQFLKSAYFSVPSVLPASIFWSQGPHDVKSPLTILNNHEPLPTLFLKTIKPVPRFHSENFSWCHYYFCTSCKPLLLNIPAMNK